MLKRVKQTKQTLLSLLLITAICLTGCSQMTDLPADASKNLGADETDAGKRSGKDGRGEAKTKKAEEVQKVKVLKVGKKESAERAPHDRQDLYGLWEDTDVIRMYLTVKSGNESDGSDHTWEEVNSLSVYDYEDMGVDRYKVEGILQVDESGKGVGRGDFGYGQSLPNVSVQIRGQTSSRGNQKNYKIKIKDGAGDFYGMRTLALNKHVADPYRFSNKLCYDLLSDIPQLMSARTRFVQLFVKDETASGYGASSQGAPGDEDAGDGEFSVSENDAAVAKAKAEGFTDYGLFTMVEPINRSYLRTHGLDENGQLYKVSFFEWNENTEIMIPQDDPAFDRKAFDSYLKIKGDEDVSKLQGIIREIHSYNIPIETVIEKHFDEENLCYWMAFNILNGNYDVGARNLYLYSPLNSEKFYMLCWDMDASFKNGFYRKYEVHEGDTLARGMTKFLGLALMNRMLKEKQYREKLTMAVEDLYRNYMSEDKVQEKATAYRNITKQFLLREPDDRNVRVENPEDFDPLTDKVGSEVGENYRNFYETLEKPWPFFVDYPEADPENGRLTLSWGASYDCEQEEITYDYTLARDYFFEDVVVKRTGLYTTMDTIDLPPEGVYYLKVRAKNVSGKSTECYDYFTQKDYGDIYGCYRFAVEYDGSVTVDEKEE
ncbi:MAG: CotH kinase family protein [Lachnospiraceae bacterium]|nr:CotH kinase family protein [Lachnospiraceae bacterium]